MVALLGGLALAPRLERPPGGLGAHLIDLDFQRGLSRQLCHSAVTDSVTNNVPASENVGLDPVPGLRVAHGRVGEHVVIILDRSGREFVPSPHPEIDLVEREFGAPLAPQPRLRLAQALDLERHVRQMTDVHRGVDHRCFGHLCCSVSRFQLIRLSCVGPR